MGSPSDEAEHFAASPPGLRPVPRSLAHRLPPAVGELSSTTIVAWSWQVHLGNLADAVERIGQSRRGGNPSARRPAILHGAGRFISPVPF